MSVQSADLHQAINAAWDSAGLDVHFKTLWPSAETTRYPVLNDQEATPGQPLPYCVFQAETGTIITRMSGQTKNSKYHTVDVPWQFRVHAEDNASDSRSAKQIAADLAEEIMKVFGGHPTQRPVLPDLDHGSCLVAQYLSDYPIRTGDYSFEWMLMYNFRLDVPIAV